MNNQTYEVLPVELEAEMVDFVVILIDEVDDSLPLHLKKTIARKAIIKDKIADQKWIKETVAQFKTDKVFTQFRLLEHKEPFEEVYGDWALPFMKKHLKNPRKIAPRWASHFMSTVVAIGKENVARESDIYTYVTSHPEWKKQKDARNIYRKKVKIKEDYPPRGDDGQEA